MPRKSPKIAHQASTKAGVSAHDDIEAFVKEMQAEKRPKRFPQTFSTLEAERDFFFAASRSMPTANAEDPRRSEGTDRRVSPDAFPTPTLRSELAPRRSPSACAENSCQK